MILALVKNSLIKEQLMEQFENINFYDNIYALLRDLKNYPQIALLLENSAAEVSGFLISIVLDKLITDRKFNIYIITSNDIKSNIISNTFKNIQSITHSDLKRLRAIVKTGENNTNEIDREQFFNTLDSLFLTEKIKNFIFYFTQSVLENIVDQNVWFNEFCELINTITGIKKILIKLSFDHNQLIFSTVKNFQDYKNLQKEFLKDINKSNIVFSEECVEVNSSDLYLCFEIGSFTEKLGEVVFIFEKNYTLKEKIEPLLSYMVLSVKTFAWYRYCSFLKEYRGFGDKLISILPRIYNQLSSSLKKYENVEVIAEKGSYFILPHKEDYYYIFSTASLLYHNLFYIYLNNILSEKRIDFEELIICLNKFINENILNLHPLPLGILKISESEALFCATEGLLCFHENEKKREVIETPMQYFGTYSVITPYIKKIVLEKDSKLKIMPDIFFNSFLERRKIIDRFLLGR